MKIVTAFVLMVVLMVVISAVVALPVMWLWNDLVPSLFNLRTISFGDAWELMVLCSLLFKNNTSSSSSK